MPTTPEKARRRWIGGLVVLTLVVLAVAAWWYARAASATGPLEGQARMRASQLDRHAAIAEASVSLATVRVDLTAERGGGALPRRLDHLEQKLERALTTGPAPADERWSEIQGYLQSLDEQIARSDPAAVETARGLDETLRAIRP